MFIIRRGLIPAVLKPQLITAKKKLLTYFRPSEATPIIILKSIGLLSFFWILYYSGRSVGRLLFLEDAFTKTNAPLIVANIGLFLTFIGYSFALPIALSELFRNPDHDLINASPYSRIGILLGRLIGIAIKILPVSMIILTPFVGFINQYHSLYTSEVLAIFLVSLLVPSSLAMFTSILLMALTPSRYAIKKGAPILLVSFLLLPLGFPQLLDTTEISNNLIQTYYGSYVKNIALDLSSAERATSEMLKPLGYGYGLNKLGILMVSFIPVLISFFLSYFLYDIALAGSSRLRYFKLPHLKSDLKFLDGIGSITASSAVKTVKILISIFSEKFDQSPKTDNLPEKFIKAFLYQEVLSIIRDPFKLTHLAFLLGLSLLYLSAIPAMFASSQFSGEFSSVVNFFLVGLLVASFANRFVITSFTRDGEANWIIHTSPLTASQVMLSKFIAWSLLLIALAALIAMMGITMVGATYKQVAILILVASAGTPSIVASALTSGLRLVATSSSDARSDWPDSPHGLSTLFAMVCATAIVSFNASIYLLIQLAPSQMLFSFWVIIFLLTNLLFTKARLAIGIRRYYARTVAITA